MDAICAATLSNAETTAEAARKDAIRAHEALEDLREKMADKPVTTTVTTGVRISASGKPLAKEEVKAAPAKAETPVVEKKAELSPEIRKKYQDAMTEAGKQEKAGNPDEAMWKYLIAADLDPEAWQPHMAMSRIYLGAGKSVKAKQEYEKALRMGMERNPAHEQAIDNAGKNSK